MAWVECRVVGWDDARGRPYPQSSRVAVTARVAPRLKGGQEGTPVRCDLVIDAEPGDTRWIGAVLRGSLSLKPRESEYGGYWLTLWDCFLKTPQGWRPLKGRDGRLPKVQAPQEPEPWPEQGLAKRDRGSSAAPPSEPVLEPTKAADPPIQECAPESKPKPSPEVLREAVAILMNEAVTIACQVVYDALREHDDKKRLAELALSLAPTALMCLKVEAGYWPFALEEAARRLAARTEPPAPAAQDADEDF